MGCCHADFAPLEGNDRGFTLERRRSGSDPGTAFYAAGCHLAHGFFVRRFGIDK